MSEYQYYEFLAIDRPLDARQRAELRALSTRARITATSFVNEYHWGDFRGNPAALMERWRLASIALVRSELAAGDLRLLYLAWLLSVQAEEVGEEEAEPPLPPGLRTLSAPLRAVADFLRIDDDLLEAAAAASAEVQTVPESAGELAGWIEDLPAAQKNALLLRAARGEGSQVQAVLQRRFRAERSTGSAPADPGTRTAGELRDAAVARRGERERLAAERKAQELARRARAAAAAREQRLDALALREEQAWQQVSSLIGTKKPREYDEAVAILADLQALAERAGNGKVFSERIKQLREQHLRKPSLIQRLDKAGLEPESHRNGMPRV